MDAQLENDSPFNGWRSLVGLCALCAYRLGSFRWILSELEVQSNFNWILIYFTRNLQVPVLVNACTSRKSKGGAGSVSKVRL